MGQTLTSAWNDVSLLAEGGVRTEIKPRIKAMDRTAGYLAQDPRSPARQGTDVDRTPIQVRDSDNGGDNETTPVTTKVLQFDPRSPGVDRSPIVVPAEDGTPVIATPVLRSKSLASKLSQNFRQKALHKAS